MIIFIARLAHVGRAPDTIRIMPSWIAPSPYLGYKVYGPIVQNRGRRMVHLVPLPETGLKRTTTTLARYLLSVKIDRKLEKWEEADHIDDNPLNDEPSNLQVLSGLENKIKSARPKTMIVLSCPNCDDEFERERRQTHLVKGGLSPTCCSRSCAVSFQHKCKAG